LNDRDHATSNGWSRGLIGGGIDNDEAARLRTNLESPNRRMGRSAIDRHKYRPSSRHDGSEGGFAPPQTELNEPPGFS
jgi:hypothetical protein